MLTTISDPTEDEIPLQNSPSLVVQAHPDVEGAPAESGLREETAWDPPELPFAP